MGQGNSGQQWSRDAGRQSWQDGRFIPKSFEKQIFFAPSSKDEWIYKKKVTRTAKRSFLSTK